MRYDLVYCIPFVRANFEWLYLLNACPRYHDTVIELRWKETCRSSLSSPDAVPEWMSCGKSSSSYVSIIHSTSANLDGDIIAKFKIYKDGYKYYGETFAILLLLRFRPYCDSGYRAQSRRNNEEGNFDRHEIQKRAIYWQRYQSQHHQRAKRKR